MDAVTILDSMNLCLKVKVSRLKEVDKLPILSKFWFSSNVGYNCLFYVDYYNSKCYF